jgi:hypothetical protein
METTVTCNKTDNLRIRYAEALSHEHYCDVRAISITYSECVFVALIIQHVKRMRGIMSSVASLSLLYFSSLSHKMRHFGKQLVNIKFVFGFL